MGLTWAVVSWICRVAVALTLVILAGLVVDVMLFLLAAVL